MRGLFGIKFLVELGFEFLIVVDEYGGHLELRAACKFHNFSFTFNQQPHCRALDATSRFASRHLLPNHGTELKTNQPVEDLPGLLRLHQIHINSAWILNGAGDGILSDLMKDDALGRLNRQIQHFTEVPGDSLPFAVFIGGQPDIVFADGFDIFL